MLEKVRLFTVKIKSQFVDRKGLKIVSFWSFPNQFDSGRSVELNSVDAIQMSQIHSLFIKFD